MKGAKEVRDAIQRLSRNMLRNSAQVARGNSVAEAKTLRLIAANRGLCAKELATMLDIRMPSLSGKLTKLEESGFVKRRKDPQDARLVRIFITKRGEAVLSAHDRQKGLPKADFSDCLTEQEKEFFCFTCHQLSDNLERLRLESGVKENKNPDRGEASMYVDDIG